MTEGMEEAEAYQQMIDSQKIENMEKLTDLNGKAAYIADKSGEKPMSWHEFKTKNDPGEPPTVRNVLIGGTIGAIIGVVIGWVTKAGRAGIAFGGGFGGLLGGGTGAVFDTPHGRRTKQIGEYEKYLDEFEKSKGLTKVPAMEPTPPAHEGEKVAQLKEKNEKEKTPVACCGR